jgi:CubicO group peptidase (beta-lactamase class C family)
MKNARRHLFVPPLGRIALCVLLVGLLNACKPAEEPPNIGARDPVWRDVDAEIARFREARGLPGISVAVLKGPEVVFAEGYGWADLEGQTPVTPETMFPIGSIEKQFTAAAVMRLVEQGKLSLDDAITDHLPDLDTGGQVVTIRDMLHQVSGLWDNDEPVVVSEQNAGVSPETASIRAGEGFDPAGYVASFRGVPLYYPPRERWSYSQANYDLMSLVIAKVRAKTYYEAVGELASAAGMKAFHPDWVPRPSADDPNIASGYLRRGEDIELAWEPNLGSAWTTAPDLARWSRALEVGAVVSTDSYAQMTTPAKLIDGRSWPYGFGLGLLRFEGRPKIVHGGSVLGFFAVLSRYPEDDISIALMTNLGRAVYLNVLEKRIARMLVGVEQPRFDEVVLPEQEKARYLGYYESGPAGFDVVPESQGIALRINHPQCANDAGTTCFQFRLRYLGSGVFVSADDPDWLEVSFQQSGGFAREMTVGWPTQAPSQGVRR